MKFKKVLKIAYVAIFFLLLLTIGVTTFVRKNNRPKKEQKVVFEAKNYLELSDSFDRYFSVNFGFRSELINMNNLVKYNLFNESGEANVIKGQDGWLFYESALHDYLGEDVLSDKKVNDIAESIKRMQDKVIANGGSFVFCVAPNKMEIYGENMPYYMVENKSNGNYEKLMSALDYYRVNYVDLKKVLTDKKSESDEIIYHKLDSHWNNIGAAKAYMKIMEKAGLDYTNYNNLNYSIKNNFTGDLYEMLFPDGKKKDNQVYFDLKDEFTYTSRFMGVDDLIITTENETALNDDVVLFRDSFGNALYSFFSRDFKNAEISRNIPYDVTNIKDKLVVVEIVERNIPNLVKYPPITE